MNRRTDTTQQQAGAYLTLRQQRLSGGVRVRHIARHTHNARIQRLHRARDGVVDERGAPLSLCHQRGVVSCCFVGRCVQQLASRQILHTTPLVITTTHNNVAVGTCLSLRRFFKPSTVRGWCGTTSGRMASHDSTDALVTFSKLFSNKTTKINKIIANFFFFF